MLINSRDFLISKMWLKLEQDVEKLNLVNKLFTKVTYNTRKVNETFKEKMCDFFFKGLVIYIISQNGYNINIRKERCKWKNSGLTKL